VLALALLAAAPVSLLMMFFAELGGPGPTS